MRRVYKVENNLEGAVSNDFPGVAFEIDQEMLFWSSHFPNLKSGEKNVTIRYRPGKIRIPGAKDMRVIDTGDNGKSYTPAGIITIPTIMVLDLIEFKDEFARLDGFENKEDMIQGMEKYYGPLPEDAVLSMYWLNNYRA